MGSIEQTDVETPSVKSSNLSKASEQGKQARYVLATLNILNGCRSDAVRLDNYPGERQPTTSFRKIYRVSRVARHTCRRDK